MLDRRSGTIVGGNAGRAMESELFCIGALWSPETGIIDSHAFMRALWGELEDRGGMIAFATPVERLSFKAPHWRVQFGGREPCTLDFDAVVNAAGLGAQALARRIEGYPAAQVPRLVLGKGNYFGYVGRPERAASGEGYPIAHANEQNRIVTTALDLHQSVSQYPREQPGER